MFNSCKPQVRFLQSSSFFPGEDNIRRAHEMLTNFSGKRLDIKVINSKSTATITANEDIELSHILLSLSFPQVAGILAHEYGHCILGHQIKERSKGFRGISDHQAELEADIYSVVFMALNKIPIDDVLQYHSSHKFNDSGVHLEKTERVVFLQKHYEYVSTKSHLQNVPMSYIKEFVINQGRLEALVHTTSPISNSHAVKQRLNF